MSSYSLLYTTVKDEHEAREIARGVVTSRLAACAHISPKGVGVYEWNGVVQEENEHIVFIKTRRDLVNDAMVYIKQHHSDDTPCVVVLSIASGDDAYLGWVSRQTSSA